MVVFNTIEERRAYYRALHKKHLAEWSPEQLAEHKRKTREYWNNCRDKQPKEKQEAIKAKVNEHQRLKWHSMSPEKREEQLQRLRAIGKRPEQRIKNKERSKRVALELKMTVFSHYCNGNPHCMNPLCEVIGGVKNINGLCLEHVNGDGYKQKEQGLVGTKLYRYIIANSYPNSYTVWCATCNQIKKIEQDEDKKAKQEKSKRSN